MHMMLMSLIQMCVFVYNYIYIYIYYTYNTIHEITEERLMYKTFSNEYSISVFYII